MNHSIYIVEDMAITRASIISTLEGNGEVVAGSSATAEKAWEEIRTLSIDLILIDIHLAGEKNGLWLAQKIKSSLDIPIIFLTAYSDNQTLEKIQSVDANGYIQKPFKGPTLIANCRLVIQNYLEKMDLDSTPKIQNIALSVGGKKILIHPSKIHFVHSDGNYLEVTCTDIRHLTRKKIGDFLEELPNHLFIQVHRRYLVNITCITAYTASALWVGKEEIPISESFKKDVQKTLSEINQEREG